MQCEEEGGQERKRSRNEVGSAILESFMLQSFTAVLIIPFQQSSSGDDVFAGDGAPATSSMEDPD